MRKVPRLLLILAFLFSMTGCTASADAENTKTVTTEPVRRLLISAVTDEDADFTTIKSEQLGGNFEEDIVYLDLTDVTVEVQGNIYPLEDAIRDGLISVEEIFAYARIDARNGICIEKYECNNSLTVFTYCYPDYDVYLVYDVYIAPDGSKHLIQDLGVYKPNSVVHQIYADSETDQLLNREDWGINFDINTVTSSHIELQYIQSGGQQIGNLYIFKWGIREIDAYEEIISSSLDPNKEITVAPEYEIQRNTSNSLVFDWSEKNVELPQGEYELYMYVIDIYNEDDVHPFMYDYSNIQDYRINFSIS